MVRVLINLGGVNEGRYQLPERWVEFGEFDTRSIAETTVALWKQKNKVLNDGIFRYVVGVVKL